MNKSIASLFFPILLITLVIYVLRGFGIFTFLPGGIILALITLSFVSGIFWGLEITRRY